MDLSWCIICDRHCIDNNLYCSESCRFQDSNDNQFDNSSCLIASRRTSVDSITTPILTPFLYSFNNRRLSTTSSLFSCFSLSKSPILMPSLHYPQDT